MTKTDGFKLLNTYDDIILWTKTDPNKINDINSAKQFDAIEVKQIKMDLVQNSSNTHTHIHFCLK